MIILKTPDEIALMAKASRVVAEGAGSAEKRRQAWRDDGGIGPVGGSRNTQQRALPAFKGYRNYPKTLCVPSMSRSYTAFPPSGC